MFTTTATTAALPAVYKLVARYIKSIRYSRAKLHTVQVGIQIKYPYILKTSSMLTGGATKPATVQVTPGGCLHPRRRLYGYPGEFADG
jgi:hypothetical protein